MARDRSQLSALQTVGFWLAAPMAALQALNAFRAFADPAGFALYLGAPLVASGDAAWVQVYGLRAAFIALLVGALLARRDLAALKWTALAALVMPLGDAFIAREAGAAAATVGRHLAIAAYLVIAFIFLSRAAARVARSAA